MKVKGHIDIIKAIVHVLNKDKDVQRLSDFQIDVNEQLSKLIIDYIKKSTLHDSRRFAKFRDESIIYKKCERILTDPSNFIEESKVISRQLFLSMKSTNAPSANLLIVYYDIDNEKAIAILKLDFDENFRTVEKKEGDKTKIDVQVDSAGFNKRQRIQKCAFIFYDIVMDMKASIIVLDKQRKNDSVSHYFMDSFLNCELINDNTQNTKNMINEVNDFINEKYDNDANMKLKERSRLTDFFKENEEFKLEDMLNKLFNDNDSKKELQDRLAHKHIDFIFDIDKAKANKLLTDMTLTTESGISIKGKASLFNNDTILIGNQDKEGYSDITIKKVKDVKII